GGRAAPAAGRRHRRVRREPRVAGLRRRPDVLVRGRPDGRRGGPPGRALRDDAARRPGGRQPRRARRRLHGRPGAGEAPPGRVRLRGRDEPRGDGPGHGLRERAVGRPDLPGRQARPEHRRRGPAPGGARVGRQGPARDDERAAGGRHDAARRSPRARRPREVPRPLTPRAARATRHARAPGPCRTVPPVARGQPLPSTRTMTTAPSATATPKAAATTPTTTPTRVPAEATTVMPRPWAASVTRRRPTLVS